MEAIQGPLTGTGLIQVSDKYDNTVRKQVIRAIHGGNTLGRFTKSSGVSAMTFFGGSSVRQYGLGNTVDQSTHFHFGGGSPPQREQKEGEEQRAGLAAILGICVLVLGGAAAAGYSANRMWEVGSARDKVAAAQKDLNKFPNQYAVAEARDSHNYLGEELEVAHEALSADLLYYRITTFATAALMLGIGSLAYDKLYVRSHKAYQVMVGSWLTAAASLGFAWGACGYGRADREEALQVLEKNYQERRVKVSQVNVNDPQSTRYDVLHALSVAPAPQSQPSGPSAPCMPEPERIYPDLKGYKPYDPWAPSAPPADQ